MESIMLLSGGLDSTVAMVAAMQDSIIKLALTFDYGQRAARREAEAAASVARHYEIEHRVMAVDFLKEITSTALVDHAKCVPILTLDRLDDERTTHKTADQVWVPNRNGLFINIAAAFADSLGYEQVVVGFNAEEGVTFPDNTPEYMAAASLALGYSTRNGVKVISPTVKLTKTEMVALGRQLHVPFQLIWSCYHGADLMCGECESCLRLKRALQQGGLAETVSFDR
jgi:7-cyano-7-deazaguanine synthase